MARPAKLMLALMLAFLLLNSACTPVRWSPTAFSYGGDIAVAWFDLALKLIQETPGFTPPVASRALGYLGVTLYETVQPGMPGYQSLGGQLNALDSLPKSSWWASYHLPVASNAALAALAYQLFPTASPENLAAIDALEARFNREYQDAVDAATYGRSVAWGQSIAAAIFAWSLTDGGHEGYARNFPEDYTPPVGLGLWVGTPPSYAKALQPYWGDNRPFVLTDGNECPAPPPYAYSEDVNSDFYREAMEVYTVGLARTQEQLAIARFWADDAGRTPTPAGHWVAILNGVVQQGDVQLGLAAEAYAKLGIAAADAFITCWNTKYQYSLLRPISYIQAVIDPAWNTPNITDPVDTPPFPEYTSGHSVQSGAAAVVLTALFGENYAFIDNTHAELGLPARAFASFHAAADEAAISRLYGGIHYRAAIEQGLEQGYCVGKRVLGLQFRQ